MIFIHPRPHNNSASSTDFFNNIFLRCDQIIHNVLRADTEVRLWESGKCFSVKGRNWIGWVIKKESFVSHSRIVFSRSIACRRKWIYLRCWSVKSQLRIWMKKICYKLLHKKYKLAKPQMFWKECPVEFYFTIQW